MTLCTMKLRTMKQILGHLPKYSRVLIARFKLFLACHLASLLNRQKNTQPLTNNPCKIMGLSLPNPIGIAAGIDKKGRLIGLTPQLGFGFLEIGSITPKTLKSSLHNLRKHTTPQHDGIVGVNISCLKNAKEYEAIEHYVTVARACLPFADYLVANLSTASTASGHMTEQDWSEQLLTQIKREHDVFLKTLEPNITPPLKPITIKITFDPTQKKSAIEKLQLAKRLNFDGVIVVTPNVIEQSSIEDILSLTKVIIGDMSLISVGGITTAQQMQHRLNCGADAVQMATGIIEHGPYIAREMLTQSRSPYLPKDVFLRDAS